VHNAEVSQALAGRSKRMAGSLNDTVAIRILRVTLDEIFIDRRFFARNAMSASEVAEYILAQLSRGERDPDP
jgi:hypothetical protein